MTTGLRWLDLFIAGITGGPVCLALVKLWRWKLGREAKRGDDLYKHLLSDISDLQSRLKVQDAKIQVLETRIEEERKAKHQYREELQQVKLENQQLRQENESLKGRVAQLEGQIQGMQSRISLHGVE